jgi:hypothetical protein
MHVGCLDQGDVYRNMNEGSENADDAESEALVQKRDKRHVVASQDWIKLTRMNI